jgi:hypothetical protein
MSNNIQRSILIFAIVMCAGTATAQSLGETVARDGEWELRQSKDNFTDKKSCVLISFKRPHIQITNTTLYISYRGRGGIQAYEVRVDDDPPSKMQLASDIEKQIQALGFQGAEFEEVLKSKRLRVKGVGFSSFVTDDIDIVAAKRLLTRMRTLCPDQK